MRPAYEFIGEPFGQPSSSRFFSFAKRTPVYLQMEAAECGAACLAMVADHYGAGLGLEEVRLRLDPSVRGMTLADIMSGADQIGLNGRGICLGLEELKQLRLPAILWWDEAHWVVLTKISRKALVIHDPAIGCCKIGFAEAERRFSGHVCELVPLVNLVRSPPAPRLKLAELMRSFHGLRKVILQLLLISVLLEAIALLTPYYVQMVVDHVLVTADVDLLTILALAYCFLLSFQVGLTAVRSWAVVVMSQNINYQLYAHVMRHLLRLPIPYFLRRQIGDLVSRFDSVQQLSQALTQSSVEIILDAVVGIGTLIMMFVYSATLGWVALGGIVFLLAIKIIVFSSSQRIVSEKVYQSAQRQSHLIETLRVVHAVKMANREGHRTEQWLDRTAKIFKIEADIERINILSALVMTALGGFVHVLVVFLAAKMVLANQFSVGMLFAFMTYQNNFFGRSANLVDRVMWLRTMRTHLGRVGDIVFTPPEAAAKPIAHAPNKLGQIMARGIGFRYSGSDPFIFRNISLDIKEGEWIALVGRSGTGKTSLLGILAGIFSPSEGGVFIQGAPLTAEHGAFLRKRIAIVFQGDELLSGSIIDNITFFDRAPDKERMYACARLACIADEIDALPHQWQTKLGEMGAGLSGGQRQRLLIARALYRQPDILFLDEATSQLDVATEKQLLDNLRNLELTIVMSAHRPDAIKSCDRIFSMETRQFVAV